jgi:hypothetical protein
MSRPVSLFSFVHYAKTDILSQIRAFMKLSAQLLSPKVCAIKIRHETILLEAKLRASREC